MHTKEWIDIQQANPNDGRYAQLEYSQCGRSGLKLPRITLGCWHNYGISANQLLCRHLIYTAFDAGINSFDLANNYGPPPGAAEENVGRILRDLPRDELIITSKAGYYMWPGPFGSGGSRKHLVSSIDQSLKRLNLDYVDIFYHHRPDRDTPLLETLEALDQIVRSGKALYIGISNYSHEETENAVKTAKENNLQIPIVNQSRHNIIDPLIDAGLREVSHRHGLGTIAFSPLAQGRLSKRYIDGVPPGSRASRSTWDKGDLRASQITDKLIALENGLDRLAEIRNQTVAQMAISWVLRAHDNEPEIASVIIGPSNTCQLSENIGALKNLQFSAGELESISELRDRYLAK